MCKAYDGEPSVDFFRGVFDLFPGEDWLTFTKRPEADVPTIFLKPITQIEDRNGRVFYVQDTIVSSGYSEFLSKANMLDKRTFKDKIPSSINETLMYQQMAFKKLLFTGDDEEMSFLPRDHSLGFEHRRFRGSPIREEMTTVASGSVAERMKNRRCMTKGSAKPPMKPESSAFLTISDDDEEVELLDIHDRCYGRQAVVDNAVNQRAQELLRIVDQMKGECGVLREREKAVDKECEELKAKCE
ncbi:hypothetical protein Tco_1445239, partial [Tanacetum coccineum]